MRYGEMPALDRLQHVVHQRAVGPALDPELLAPRVEPFTRDVVPECDACVPEFPLHKITPALLLISRHLGAELIGCRILIRKAEVTVAQPPQLLYPEEAIARQRYGADFPSIRSIIADQIGRASCRER